MVVTSRGYEDIVAFEDAQQLLGHQRTEPPSLAVIDAWTARFDATAIRRTLLGVPLVVVGRPPECDEAWRSFGAVIVRASEENPEPRSFPTASVAGFGPCEALSGTRSVPPELHDHPKAQSLEDVLARFAWASL